MSENVFHGMAVEPAQTTQKMCAMSCHLYVRYVLSPCQGACAPRKELNRSGLGLLRQAHGKRRAGPQFTIHLDRAAMRLDNRFANRKAQTDTTIRAGARFIR